ncbi:MAG: NUDIX hydrolase [Acidimicrobiales bacterium]|jgi:ADP-ribose pyrophosphatase YjhB (NUDIX family)|nr:NUDIX hydrolase [Acidimicrobiales bacterium]MDP6298679.1 NUDIX hydrolase [Acidimicrobiales bacterium]HJM28841.1 NUDIX hydrolase [Acidimicrobiales bacterium]HJM97102.1 NUDIX hydrolase [Acidimicrobiales bacterium]
MVDLQPINIEPGLPGSMSVAISEIKSVLSTSNTSNETRHEILDFIQEHPDALYRSCIDGHLTGSAAIVDHTGEHLLVMLHKKLQIWLQPGGHADGDGLLSRVALQEASEESGIEGLQLFGPGIDCDIHVIPSRGADPEHLHLDTRYLIRAPEGSKFKKNHESIELRWVTQRELLSLTDEESTLRLAKVAIAAANESFII